MIIMQIIPQPTAEHYINALKGLVATVRSAVEAGGSWSQAAGWQQNMLPLLEGQLKAAQTAMRHHAIGDQEPLVSLALRSRYLARDTDGYSLRFAGEELAQQYEERRRLVVFAAWQVCESAGVV
jgi:hypothetical protein